MLEQTCKSSGLSALNQKLWVDLRNETSFVEDMGSDHEIDAIKARTGLIAVITARLEDAHDEAVSPVK